MLCVSINQHATAEISKFGGRRSTTISTAPLIFTHITLLPGQYATMESTPIVYIRALKQLAVSYDEIMHMCAARMC